MNVYSKIAEGLASWLTFEQRCGRKALFSETYLVQPLGQLLQYRFPGRVLPEVDHPVLAPRHLGSGRKPRIDYAITGPDGLFDLAVEAKWVSASPTLLRDVIRDVIRLDMLVGQHARAAIPVLAGTTKHIARLFSHSLFRPHPHHLGSNPILPLGNLPRASIRFMPIPAFRRSLYAQALRVFRGLPISYSIRLERSGPFPRQATAGHYEVCIWRIVKYHESCTFVPEDEYTELSSASADER